MKKVAIIFLAGMLVFGEFVSESNASGAVISNVKAGRKNIIQSGIYDKPIPIDSNRNAGGAVISKAGQKQFMQSGIYDKPIPIDSNRNAGGADISNVKAGRKNIIQSGIYNEAIPKDGNRNEGNLSGKCNGGNFNTNTGPTKTFPNSGSDGATIRNVHAGRKNIIQAAIY